MKWIQQNYAYVFFLFLLCAALVFPFQDGDLFFYLSLGRTFFETGSMPSEDPYLFTLKDWHIAHQWLFYILFYAAYWLADWAGILILEMSLWLLAFGFMARAARQWKIPASLALVLILFVALSCVHRFVPRASLVSDVSLALLAGYFLRSQIPSRKVLWVLPLLFLVWVNLHPGFILGLAVVGAYLVTHWKTVPRWLWAAGPLSALAVLINPLFVEGALYPVTTAFKEEWNYHRKFNYEWMPTFQEPFLSTWEVQCLIVLLAMTSLLVVWKIWRKPRGSLFAVILLGLAIYLAQDASRFMPTSALLCGFIGLWALREAPIPFKEIWDRGLQAAWALGFAVVTLIILNDGYVAASGHRKPGVGIDMSQFPVKAVEFIEKNGIQGRIFNQYDWGSYLVWALNRPDSLFIHGHVDDPMLLGRGYHGMNASREFFEKSVRDYNLQYFLLDRAKLAVKPPILGFLQSWTLIYQDETSVLWKRP